MKLLQIRYFTLWLLFLLGIGIADAKTFRFDYQKSIDVAGGSELNISNTDGRIEIVGSPGGQVVINAVKYVRAADETEAEELGANIEIKVNRNNNRISIQTNYLRDSERSRSFWSRLFGSGPDTYGGVDYSITVPQDCRLEIDNGAGDIAVSDAKGDLFINSSSGDLRLFAITGDIDIEKAGSGDLNLSEIDGDIAVSATSGDLSLESISGASDIRMTNGNIRGNTIVGSVIVTQSSGDFLMKRLSGDLRLRTNAGSVDIEQDSGAVDIVSQAGDINIRTELDTYHDCSVRTSAGRILFAVPETAAGVFKLETSGGEIKTDLQLAVRSITRNRLVGESGSGGPKITLNTASGYIELMKY